MRVWAERSLRIQDTDTESIAVSKNKLALSRVTAEAAVSLSARNEVEGVSKGATVAA